MLAYLALLIKWNRIYNLTAIRDEERMVSHHILDSLAVLRHLPDGSVVDVGSGAGLPGIPIAIASVGRPVTLLDSNHKKSAFLNQVVAELRLPDVRVVTERVENYHSRQPFTTVISRAFAELADFVKLAGHLCAADGALIAMKGLHPDAEIALLPSPWEVEKVERLEIPGLEATRHLIFLRQSAITVTA
ncbi:MAG: 16S rRNA (guanine(527)-N(7))-methyltransferase RsmG [Betaproteobacteria bacterium]